MPDYQYIAINAEGRKIKGTITAANQLEFNEELRARGEYCMSVQEMEAAGAASQKSRKIKLKQLSLFFRQLSTMLKAGITIVQSLEIISRQIEDKDTQDAVLKIYGSVQEGKGLGESMRRLGNAFPPFSINMVQSGEISGSLDVVVTKLAEYYEKEVRTRAKITQAMIYPIVLAVLTVLVVVILLVFVMPALLKTFEETGAALPVTTRILLAISNFIKTKWYIIIAVVALVYAATKFLLSAKQIRMKWDKFKFAIPKFGSLYLTIISARFSRCLYALFSGGTSLITAMEMSAKVVGNTYVEYELLQAKDEVSKGKSLSEALKAINLFPVMMLSLFSIGEQSGSLDAMILRTADIYDEESDNAITKMVSLLEPVMIIIMAVIVGFIVISIIQPIYGSMGTVL